MIFLYTVFCFLCALSAALLCGYGLAAFLLPAPYKRFRLLVAPSIGYAVLSGLSYVLSGSLHLAASTSARITFGSLGVLSLVALIGGIRREGFRPLIRGAGQLIVLPLPMLIFTLWPLFYVGPTYLGAV